MKPLASVKREKSYRLAACNRTGLQLSLDYVKYVLPTETCLTCCVNIWNQYTIVQACFAMKIHTGQLQNSCLIHRICSTQQNDSSQTTVMYVAIDTYPN